nr:hypothetical protein Itr_chr03CG08640 [Ipomoea trifida]
MEVKWKRPQKRKSEKKSIVRSDLRRYGGDKCTRQCSAALLTVAFEYDFSATDALQRLSVYVAHVTAVSHVIANS